MFNFDADVLRQFKDFIGKKNSVNFNNIIYDKKVPLVLKLSNFHSILKNAAN